jgi:hypothetical protein
MPQQAENNARVIKDYDGERSDNRHKMAQWAYAILRGG